MKVSPAYKSKKFCTCRLANSTRASYISIHRSVVAHFGWGYQICQCCHRTRDFIVPKLRMFSFPPLNSQPHKYRTTIIYFARGGHENSGGKISFDCRCKMGCCCIPTKRVSSDATYVEDQT